MGIREIARSCEAFAELQTVYERRDEAARGWRAAGEKVVARLGCDVPDELLLAAGLKSVQVCADPFRPLVNADRYLEYAFDPVVRAAFEKLTDGAGAEIADYLAISNSTDVLIRTYLYLRELKRTEPERPLPEPAFIDWLFTRNRLHQARNEHTVRLFWEQVERWAGHPVTKGEFEAAAAVCNADRAALRRIGALRREGRVAGSEALVLIGSALFMDRARHAALVNAVADEAAGWPMPGGVRVFVTGSNQEDTGLYERLEAAGAFVAGEDFDWGDRFYDRDIDLSLPPVRALVDRYMLREFSSKKAFVSQRVEALAREVEAAEALAVVFYSHIYEEAASWDYPSQKRMLDERGVPSVSFCRMTWPVETNEGLEEALRAFFAGWKGGC